MGVKSFQPNYQQIFGTREGHWTDGASLTKGTMRRAFLKQHSSVFRTLYLKRTSWDEWSTAELENVSGLEDAEDTVEAI